MVVVGGLSRLPDSGLSMLQWTPLLGVTPPLHESDWINLFHQYQAYPEYQQLNEGMTLAGFKSIYWLEYVHRLWGRLIGLVFLVPFLYFAASGRIERRLRPRLTAVFLLGALQGGLGWYMVKSGLIDDPRVSHFRLTAHLGLALAILAAELWVALGLLLMHGIEVSDDWTTLLFGSVVVGIGIGMTNPGIASVASHLLG